MPSGGKGARTPDLLDAIEVSQIVHTIRKRLTSLKLCPFPEHL